MLPTILLVEDDPVTCAFMAAAIEGIPAGVATADCAAAAWELARARSHDLWLFDANLPDGSGADLLARLRDHGIRTPALAHTAAQEHGAHAALIAAGFGQVLVKPMPAASLQAAIRAVLDVPPSRVADADEAFPDHQPARAWDDAAALAALNGQRAHVDALRKLFLAELPAALERARGAAGTGDADGLRQELHKLGASCGFVGAARLQAAARMLQAQPRSDSALARFLDAAQDTLSSA